MAADLELDVQYMRRAIRLAMNGRGRVEPNPMVGCVIVKEGRVIGEGYHQQYGGPHAEPNALAACSESPAGSTVYVTLEPCCHVNKQTPPCVPRLIEAKVRRVVIGCFDPNPSVNGKGASQLREAGIVVEGPVLEAECRQLVAPFIAGMTYHLPYVTLKWAQTADGKIAGPGGSRLQISNPASTRLVHQLRARSDAIMVGVNTVLADDPLLSVREVPAWRDLLRVVLDSRLRIPLESRLIKSCLEGQPLFIYHAKGASQNRSWPYLFDSGVVEMPLREEGGLSLSAILRDLNGRRTTKHFGRPVTQLLVEPGPTLAESFIRENLVDRVWVFRSPNAANDVSAPAAALVPEDYLSTGELSVDGDVLIEYLNPRSEVFFAAEASADLVLTRGNDVP